MKKIKKDRARRKEVDARWEERSRRKGKGIDKRVRKRSSVEERVRKAQGGRGGLERKGEAGKGRGDRKKRKRVTKRSEGRRKGLEVSKGEKERRRRKEKQSERGGEKTKVRNRCVDTGNGRSVLRWFRKSGRQVRERARQGKLEGVYRVSW